MVRLRKTNSIGMTLKSMVRLQWLPAAAKIGGKHNKTKRKGMLDTFRKSMKPGLIREFLNIALDG